MEVEQDDEYAAHGVAEHQGEMLLTVVDIINLDVPNPRVFINGNEKT